jgi:branched-chain amino acid transport system substrate-binding protein
VLVLLNRERPGVEVSAAGGESPRWRVRVGAFAASATIAISLPAFALAQTPTASPVPTMPLTVYSSLPLSGGSRLQALAISRGAALALEQSGGVAGGHAVRYVSLDDATSFAGFWTPEQTSANAQTAAGDASTMGYIGEFNSGASAVSIPILNLSNVPQISPSNTAIGLTRAAAGTGAGEPARYYPSGHRTYVRLAPNDLVEGGALAVAMRDRGCRRIAALTDGERYGVGVGASMRRHARSLGIRVVFAAAIERRRHNYRALTARVRRSRAGCVAYTGITANGAVRLFRDLGTGLPRAKLFGSDGIAESGFADPRRGGITARLARRVFITVPTLVASAYTALGRQVLDEYTARYGDPNPDPYALYGYEAMRLILDALNAVGPDREAIVRWLFAVRKRASVLGEYGFDRHGDTTSRLYGVFRVRDGQLSFAGAVRAPDESP